MNRRAFLGTTSAAAALWALGCRGGEQLQITPLANGGEVRTWLRDAVTRLAAVFPAGVHALATSRHRVTAAADVVGEGVSRARVDGVVLTVRAADGTWVEQVTSDLSRAGIETAVTALVGKAPRPTRSLEFGTARGARPGTERDPTATETDTALVERARALLKDPDLSSRIVYAAGVVDIDDSRVWSIARGRDQEQRLVRVRRSATRVAWNGTKPIVTEAAMGWTGGLDDHRLDPNAISRATRGALRLMTQGELEGGEMVIALDPSVTALVIGNATRALLTSDATRLPEVAQRLAAGAAVASEALTLVDDPTTRGAYGGFAFDDEGVEAAAITLLDRGHIAGRLSDRASGGGGRGLRAGHVGRVMPGPSHLRLTPGTRAFDKILDDGYRLEGALEAVIDPSSDRISVSAARAVEFRGGHQTGRVFADVELVGDLATLLASVTDVAKEAEVVPIRDEVAGLPRWSSIEAPGVVTRGMIRTRRAVTR